ncbi:MAG: hypothetical protein ACFFD8_03565 [Candidatus Thorarchaeota archaeon]
MSKNRRNSSKNSKLVQEEFTKLERLVHEILTRAQPAEELANLELFLTNVLLFIKRVDGLALSEDDIKYPPHPQFAHNTLTKGRGTAAGLKNRIMIIARYQLLDVQRIISTIASTAVSTPKSKLTARQIRIILELHQNPLMRRFELAQQLSTTSQIIKQELEAIRRHFSFAVIHNIDYHKFKLGLFEIDFHTKSLNASEELEQFFRGTPPLFFRRLCFDHDYRLGYLTFMIPDQPRGHQMLAERINWLQDTFLEKVNHFRVISGHVVISFDSYDPTSGEWLLSSETISKALLEFAQQKKSVHIAPQGAYFTNPMSFDRIDFLIAQTPHMFGQKKQNETRQKVLESHGYSLARKTIWNREQKLWNAGVYFPTVWFDIPGLEELVQYSIVCTPEAREKIRLITTILPYCYLVTSNIGLFFTFQRPSRCASLIGLLLRMISEEEGVSKVTLFRYEPSYSPQMLTQTATRWDENRQRWNLQEGDI